MILRQTMVLVPDGPEHRLHRKLSHLALNPGAVFAFTKVQRDSILRCISRLATTRDFDREIRVCVPRRTGSFAGINHALLGRAVARSIVEMVYGIKIDSIDDPVSAICVSPSAFVDFCKFIVCADTVFGALGDALVPGRYLADTIPYRPCAAFLRWSK